MFNDETVARLLSGRSPVKDYGARGTGHRFPHWLMLYEARIVASSSFFSPMPILLNLSRILRIFVSLLIITTILYWRVMR